MIARKRVYPTLAEKENKFRAGQRVATAAMFAVMLAGCSTYVDIPVHKIQEKYADPEVFPRLTEFINAYEVTRHTKVQGVRNHEARARQILGLVTFGAGLGAGTAALYDAHRDLVLGFGLAGATSYTGSTLFFSPIRTILLNTANKALACITDTADTMVATGITVSSRREFDEGLQEQVRATGDDLQALLVQVNDANIGSNGSDIGNAEKAVADGTNAIATFDKAMRNFGIFLATDAQSENQVRTAARNVINELNTELAKNEPSPERILQAALALGSMSIGFADAAINAVGTTPAAAAAAAGLDAKGIADLVRLTENLNALLSDLNAASKAVEDTIRDAVNALTELDTKCAFTPTQLVDMAVEPTEVSIAKDVQLRVRITGGKTPYFVEWEQDPPANQASFVLLGNTILLSGKSGIAAGKYKLRVTDSRAATKLATVTVNTLAP